MVILAQRNPLWGDTHLGVSSLTIKEAGCTTTCLAMLNNKFGANCTPDQVAKHKEWYTNAGLILWNKLKLKNTMFVWRAYKYDPMTIKSYLKDPNKGVLTQVPLPHGKQHWLLADSYSFIGGKLMAFDPWHGDLCDVVQRYGSVIGAAYFEKRIPPLP